MVSFSAELGIKYRSFGLNLFFDCIALYNLLIHRNTE